MLARHRLGGRLGGLLLAALLAACAGQRPREVAPAEIPDLEARLAREPQNLALRARYAAALFAANRCGDAAQQARQVQQQRPGEALAVLILGQCAEQAARYDEALALYRGFLGAFAGAPGAGAVRGREQVALRAWANQQARLALQNEAQLAQQPGDPNTLAVLPLAVAASDTALQPIGRGLAQMIVSDLALIPRFRLVERLQLAALLEELRLAQTGRVDPATAARVGRLVQAGRLVHGVVAVPSRDQVRLDGSVVQPTGEVASTQAITGRFRDLLRLEKDLVVALAARLGYQLSEAERRRILENGTQNLTAFLAYSRGLLAEDAGDFQRAAAYFSDAVRSDPGFQAAREGYQAAAATAQVQAATPSQVTTVASLPPPAPPAAQEPALSSAVQGSTLDVSANQAERTAPSAATQTGSQSGSTPSAAPPPTVRNSGTPSSVTATIRIVFRLP